VRRRIDRTPLFHNRDLRGLVADLLGVTSEQYTASNDLRPAPVAPERTYFPATQNQCYFVTPYGWKVARLFSRLDAHVFRPAMGMFTANDAVLPFPLRQALERVDTQLDRLIYDAVPPAKSGLRLDTFRKKSLTSDV
jgi:hypothetical protein